MALEYGVIVGRYRSTIASPPDDDDDVPNLEPLVGTIILDPRPEVILVDDTAAEGAMTITPMPTRVQLDANGDLTHNGKPYVKLLSPESSSIDTHDWTYEVSFDLRTLDGTPVRMNSYDIFVKASHTIQLPLDLTKATPVIRNTGTQTIIGPSNVLSIGKVVSGPEAQAIITGTSPEQTLDLVLPRGETGLTPQVQIGTVETIANPADAAWIAQLILAGGPVMTDALKAVLPSTMKGDKGEPGGWTNGAEIGTADLNDVITPGLYKATSAANVTIERHYPIPGSHGTGVLEVFWQGNTTTQAKVQRYTIVWGNSSARVVFIRHYTSGTWGPWNAITTQRVDNTAGRAIYTWDETSGREQMIYGDTGLRDISSLMTGVTVPAGTWPSMRRVGTTVTITFNGVTPAENTTGYLELLQIPAGFRAPQTINMYASINTGASPIKSFQVTNGYMVRLYQNPSTTDQIRERVIYDTNDPWPSVLPGTAR